MSFQVTKIITFTPLLLQIVVDDSQDASVRQAGVIYLKNTINRYWDVEKHRCKQLSDGDAPAFLIHEQDRHLVRENILNAIIVAAQPIKSVSGLRIIRVIQTAIGGMRHDDSPT